MKSLLSKIIIERRLENANISEENKIIPLSSRRIVQSLFFVACGFLVIHFIGVLLVFKYGMNSPMAQKIYEKINMSKEFSIPTIYSFTILLFASVLLYLISRIESEEILRNRVQWKLLSIIFLFLSFDEAFSVHEKFSHIRDFLPLGPEWYVRRAWVFPYTLFVIVVGIIFLKFLFRLPKKTRTLFIVAGACYCIAAMGFELIEAYVGIKIGNEMYVHMINGIEEFLEIASIILFIHALLDYMTKMRARISFLRPSKNS